MPAKTRRSISARAGREHRARHAQMAQDVAPTAAIHFRERMLPAKRRGAARDREAAKRARGRTWVVTGVCMTANSARSDECGVD